MYNPTKSLPIEEFSLLSAQYYHLKWLPQCWEAERSLWATQDIWINKQQWTHFITWYCQTLCFFIVFPSAKLRQTFTSQTSFLLYHIAYWWWWLGCVFSFFHYRSQHQHSPHQAHKPILQNRIQPSMYSDSRSICLVKPE